MIEPVPPSPIARQLYDHVSTAFPVRRVDNVRWAGGGLVENVAELSVVRVVPPDATEPWLVLSAGASAETMEEGYGLEFYLLARGEPEPAVRLVSMVAQIHADPRYPLSLGQVIEIGHPWLPGSTCDHLLVSLPGPFGDEFEWSSAADHTARLIWLLPITAAEAKLAKDQGFQALQERLGAAEVDPTELQRRSAV